MGQFPSGARPALPRRHAFRNRLGYALPAAAAPAPAGILPVPARHLRLSAALQGPSTRAGGLSDTPLLNPESSFRALRSDSRHPLCTPPAALNLSPARLPSAVRVGQFPSGAPFAVPHGRPDRLDRAAPGGCSATAGDISCRCGTKLPLSAALQGPSTRAGGLRIPPAEPRIVPQALRSDSRHPLCMPPALTTALRSPDRAHRRRSQPSTPSAPPAARCGLIHLSTGKSHPSPGPPPPLPPPLLFSFCTARVGQIPTGVLAHFPTGARTGRCAGRRSCNSPDRDATPSASRQPECNGTACWRQT